MKDRFKLKLFLGLGIIVGSIAGAAVGLYFLSQNLHTAADKLTQDRVMLANQTAALASLADLKRDAPMAAKYQTVFNKLLPDQYHLIGFGQWLGTIATKHSVAITFGFQGNPVPPSPVAAGTAGFSLSVSGVESNDLAFLKDIETQQSAFLLTLNSFDVTNNGSSTTVATQGTVFFQ